MFVDVDELFQQNYQWKLLKLSAGQKMAKLLTIGPNF